MAEILVSDLCDDRRPLRAGGRNWSTRRAPGRRQLRSGVRICGVRKQPRRRIPFWSLPRRKTKNTIPL